MSIARLRAIQELKKNPEMIKLIAEFKRAKLNGTIVQQYQLESEEEAAMWWLNEEDKRIK
jgi:hypothetical protein